MNKGDNDKKKRQCDSKKTVRLRENVWIREEEKEKKIPDENASYGNMLFSWKIDQKKDGLYVYIKQKKEKGFLSIC